MTPTITAFEASPDRGQGLARDMRVRWALEEAGQPYDVRLVSFQAMKEPAHRALHPFGQIPTYEEGDLALFESGAIVLHIADSAPGLLPEGPNARARAAEWVFAALNTLEPHLSDWAMAELFEADKTWSAQRKPGIRERIDERLGELSRRLGEDDWLEGEFSAGDLVMIAVLQMIGGEIGDLIEAYPNLVAYRKRGEARPAYKRALEAQLAGFTGDPPPGWTED